MLDWIAFAAKAPPAGPIVAVWTTTGDPWAVYGPKIAEAISKVEADHGGMTDPHEDLATFAHTEILSCSAWAFGIKIYRDEGRGKELSEYDYNNLLDNGWWITVEDFLRAVGPEGIVPCVVNGSMQGVITEIGA